MTDLKNLSLSWLAGIALGLTIFGIVAGAGCGPKTRATIHDTATCAESKAAKDLQPMIASVLTSTDTIATALLAVLETTIGPQLLDCIVAAVKADLLSKQGADAATAAEIKRCDAWLGRHKAAAIGVSRAVPAVAYRMGPAGAFSP